MSRPAFDTLAAQLSASLNEMTAALRRQLSESPADSPLTESPAPSESPRVDSSSVSEVSLAESPFRKPSAPVEKITEPNTPRSVNGLLDAIVAAFRRLVDSAAPARPPVSTRPTKRFRTARHRVRKH